MSCALGGLQEDQYCLCNCTDSELSDLTYEHLDAVAYGEILDLGNNYGLKYKNYDQGLSIFNLLEYDLDICKNIEITGACSCTFYRKDKPIMYLIFNELRSKGPETNSPDYLIKWKQM